MPIIGAMDVEHRTLALSRVDLHVALAGRGDPVVLLHGWPQTWREWRKVMALIAPHHRVIAPDLPGLGDSSRPAGGYDKKTLARDLVEMCERVGARALPSRRSRLGRPHRVRARRGDSRAGAYADHPRRHGPRHRSRHLAGRQALAPRLPHDARAARDPGAGPRARVPRLVLREFSWRKDAIEAADVDEYVRCYSAPGALEAGFAFYRNIPQDRADNAALHASGFRLPMPVLALGGARTESRGRGEEPLESLREIADDVRGGAIAEAGHFIPEEQPEVLAAKLLEHFRRG